LHGFFHVYVVLLSGLHKTHKVRTRLSSGSLRLRAVREAGTRVVEDFQRQTCTQVLQKEGEQFCAVISKTNNKLSMLGEQHFTACVQSAYLWYWHMR